MEATKKLKKQIRIYLLFFIVMLVISGLTASFVETELAVLVHYFKADGPVGGFLHQAYIAIKQSNADYPFLAYGFDWLAFGHCVIAAFFLGPLIRPEGNAWVLLVGMGACIAIFPVVLIAGYFRQIPFFWQLIDCCFGALGIIPLMLVHQNIKKLEAIKIEQNIKNSTIQN